MSLAPCFPATNRLVLSIAEVDEPRHPWGKVTKGQGESVSCSLSPPLLVSKSGEYQDDNANRRVQPCVVVFFVMPE
jgi:hypothetical protein